MSAEAGPTDDAEVANKSDSSSIQSAHTAGEDKPVEAPETTDYFNTTEPETHDVSPDCETGATSLESDILSTESQIPTSPEPSPLFDSVSTAKKVPGWKGWLRSASSTAASTASRPTSLIRKVTSPAPVPTLQDSTKQALSSLIDRYNVIRDSLSLSEQEIIDWDFYKEIVESEQPPDTLALQTAIRAGFPEQIRGILWQALMNSNSVDVDKTYSELQSTSSTFDKQVKKDIGRMPKVWHKALDKRTAETQ